MSKQANIKNQEKLKTYLAKHDPKPNNKTDKKLRGKSSAN
jgi:hypothetical protein